MSTNTSPYSVRLSWASMIAGLGVVISIVMNYAAYDTRITVLEKAMIVDQKIVSELQQDVKTLNDSLNTIKVTNATSNGQVVKITSDIDRMQRTIDDMSNTLKELELQMQKKRP